MRVFACSVLVFGLGCASSKFDVAESPSADGGADTGALDTAVVEDSSSPPPPDADVNDVQTVDASGLPCVTIDDCTPGEFCERPKCGVVEGHCKPYVTETTFDPVCACDGVTYWNRSYANLSDAIVASIGPCRAETGKACDGVRCSTPDTLCVHEEASAACTTGATKGVCWKLPIDATCGAKPGMSVSVCGEGVCLSHCEAALTGRQFYSKSCTF